MSAAGQPPASWVAPGIKLDRGRRVARLAASNSDEPYPPVPVSTQMRISHEGHLELVEDHAHLDSLDHGVRRGVKSYDVDLPLVLNTAS